MSIKKEIITSIKVFVGFSIILGLIYPLAITAIAQISMPQKANGSLIEKNGKVVGSSLIGQKFDTPEYFNSRPSAVDYNASGSGASNFGPSNKKFAEIVYDRIEKLQLATGKDIIPADAVLASASGLDPDISLGNAKLQIPRISKVRGISETKLDELVNNNIDSDLYGLWGQKSVNVLKLNLELDKAK